jgi:hypothetical protein
MDRVARCRHCVAGLLLLASIAAGVCQARVAQLEIDSLQTSALRAQSLELRLDWPDAAAAATLSIDAAVLDAGDLGYRFNDVSWRCELQSSAAALACSGPLRARGKLRGTLVARWQDDRLDLTLSADKGEVSIAMSDAPLRIRAVKLPAAWLQPLLGARWADGRLTAGRIDADLSMTAATAVDSGLAGSVALVGLGLDTADGRIAAADLDASGKLEFGWSDRGSRVASDLTLSGGELLAGALYLALPESPVELGLAMHSAADGAWQIERLHWADAGTLTLEASARIEPAASSPLAALDLRVAIPTLQRAYPRYFESILAGLGLAGLVTDGAMEARVAMQAGRLQHLDTKLHRISLRDAQDRFAIDTLDGGLAWTRDAAPLDSELRWGAAQLYRIDLGPTFISLRSRDGGIELRNPMQVELLGGTLGVPRFAWRSAQQADADGALDMALSLRAIELARLSAAFGWPAFGGTLTGEIPAVRYADQKLIFDGGLDVGVFDGDVDIDELVLERPFGVAPTMAASIALRNLDLKPLTGAFGFGEISGRLQGQVRDLRLVDWAPVAFDARFETSTTSKDPRRISQRAVQDLSSVGGAGLVAGLQSQVLKLFDTFGYARLGLSCRLANNVCRMGGLDSSGAGYTIVEGSGLPRITVIGHQEKVDWPVLVARLKAATDGQTPIIE